MIKRIIFAFLLIFACQTFSKAQNFYGLTNTGQLYSFSAASCQYCSVLSLNGIDPVNLFTNGDLFVLPNGNILITQGTQLLVYAPNNPNPIFVSNGTYYSGTAAGPGGLIYMVGGNASPPNLYTFNPSTNAITLVGPFSSSISSISDLFYVNGQLYAVGFLTVLAVNTSNPAASVPTGQLFNTDFAVADEGFFIGDPFGAQTFIFGQFDPVSGAISGFCTFLPGGPTLISLQQIPSSAPPPPPCGGGTCTTDAGTINSTPINLCIPDNLAVPYNGNAALDPNDILRYVLLSDPANPAGSIIATSTTPTILYNSGLISPGVTYYTATVAGNNIAGNIDLSDPCLDFSNLVSVVWRLKPTVGFALSNPNVCQGDCTDINITFTGTPPFSLSVQVLSGATVIDSFTESFTGLSALLQFCPPPGTPTGSILIQATALTDAFCTCN